MVETITQNQARWMVKRYHGRQIFTVTFVKRSNGETRTMNCRKGVVKGTNGVGLKFNPADHNLVVVRDVQKRQHRCISLDEIKKISIKGRQYIVSK